MPLLNRFLPYSDSWHVVVNSDIKHTMLDMDMRNIGMHDMVKHDLAVHDLATMTWPCPA
jgi:hypothetical protein